MEYTPESSGSRKLKKQPPEFKDQPGDMAVVVHFDKKSETAFVIDKSGAAVPAVALSWFGWNDFYPDTLVFNASPNRSKWCLQLLAKEPRIGLPFSCTEAGL